MKDYFSEAVALRQSLNPTSGSQNGTWKTCKNLIDTVQSSSLFSCLGNFSPTNISEQ